jgi:hypothetical protein
LKIADGETGVAHVTGHSVALEDPARGAARSDGAWRPMAVGLAVGLRPTVESMSLNTAGEASPLGEPHGVDLLAHLERAYVESLADLKFRYVLGIHFSQMAEQGSGGIEMPFARIVESLYLAKAELHGVVSIRVGCLDLRNDTRTYLNSGYTYSVSALGKELSRAYFLAYQRSN